MTSRLYAAAVLAGIAILVITLVVVFQYGRYDPSPPSLVDTPNPAIPGKVLYVNERQCAVVVEASGTSESEVYCFGRDRAYSTLYWVDATTFAFAVHTGMNVQEIVEVDIVTGEASEPRSITGSAEFANGGVSPDGASAFADGEGIVIVKDGVRTVIAELKGGDYHQAQPTLWSPDGQWLLLQYSPPRGGTSEIWVMSRDGATSGTLVPNRGGWGAQAWWIDGVGSWPKLPE